MTKLYKILIISYFAILIVVGTYMNFQDVLKMWPASLLICFLIGFLFFLNRYPEIFSKILVNKFTSFICHGMIYILMGFIVIFLIFMTSRLLGFTIDALKIAILKCFWIIK